MTYFWSTDGWEGGCMVLSDCCWLRDLISMIVAFGFGWTGLL